MMINQVYCRVQILCRSHFRISILLAVFHARSDIYVPSILNFCPDHGSKGLGLHMSAIAFRECISYCIGSAAQINDTTIELRRQYFPCLWPFTEIGKDFKRCAFVGNGSSPIISGMKSTSFFIRNSQMYLGRSGHVSGVMRGWNFHHHDLCHPTMPSSKYKRKEVAPPPPGKPTAFVGRNNYPDEDKYLPQKRATLNHREWKGYVESIGAKGKNIKIFSHFRWVPPPSATLVAGPSQIPNNPKGKPFEDVECYEVLMNIDMQLCSLDEMVKHILICHYQHEPIYASRTACLSEMLTHNPPAISILAASGMFRKGIGINKCC